ncbi:MAG: type I DNA topoisomerase [Patescibacteria group bacterium]
MNIIIVESPTKGRTIKNFLGSGYKILASFGHVRDLPKKELGVDLENNFSPSYVIPPKARKTIKSIKEEIKNSDNLYLATDYDREGEAIAWHILQAADIKKIKIQNPKLKIHRITFHEITKPAILTAIQHPREINLCLVDAQQARRILDRLVGYQLSPFLWKKVAQGLSAGRVQSVAVRLVVEKEREIRKFVPEEFWKIVAFLNSLDSPENIFKAVLTSRNGQKIDNLAIKNKNQAQEIFDDLNKAKYLVKDIKYEDKIRQPFPPFTTSSLQQEAGRSLGFSAKKTMVIAQNLYEKGLITYMRTDSWQVSPIAINQARQVIENKFGGNFLPEKGRIYITKIRGAQEAHEAIRPTNLKLESIDDQKDNARLYQLIWQKMIASQMKEAIFEEIKVEIAALTNKGRPDYGFETISTKIKFAGYQKVYQLNQNEQKSPIIPKLAINQKLNLNKIEKNQHFTEPPPRYTEASLIRELEKRGIGRPSTYAPTLSTIVERGYVEKVQGKLIPLEIGEIVTDTLCKHFPEIVNYDFTAKMENDLDEIALGKYKWQEVLKKFYDPFEKNLTYKMEAVSKNDNIQETDKVCPKCSKKLQIRLGRYGKFIACSGFPDCKYTQPLLKNHVSEIKEKEIVKEIMNEKCSQCGKNLILKEGKFGPFLACPDYPKCKYTKNLEIAAKVLCPKCGGKLIKKMTRKRKTFWGCKNYPSCKTAFWDEPLDKKCPQCDNILTFNSKLKLLKCSQCQYVGKSEILNPKS